MLRHRNIDRICCLVLAAVLLITCGYMGAGAAGLISSQRIMGYENRLFDTSRVHTLDIVMDDWEGFLASCTDEEYVPCHVVIDGESYKNVAIRAKGNTSLSSVRQYGNNRYSFKIEFDHYQTGATYHGLDKLSLNNLIQDNTYMKDYFAYSLMRKGGAAAPLCSFVQINVNGEPWGLYLAVEGVEDSFLRRNFGNDTGELYKPDSMSFGGGRGNGKGFDMEDFRERFQQEAGETDEAEPTAAPNATAPSGGFDPAGFGGMTPPEGMTMPEGGAIPDGFTPPEGMEMPANGMFPSGDGAATPSDTTAAPDTMSPSAGFDPAGFGGMTPPEGMTMPEGGAIPDGFTPPEGMEMPANGMFPSDDGAAAPSDTTAAPDATAPSGGFDPAAFGDMPSMPDFGNDRGGRGGMGSSDVMLQYTDDDPSSYSNIFNNAKTDVSEADQQRLIQSLKALSEGDTAAADTDAVIRYLAVHNFLCNDDSYTGAMVHNYYLYEKDGVLSMLPWDYNLAFGGFGMGGGFGMSGATSTVNQAIDSPVTSGDLSSRPMVAWIFDSEDTIAAYHEAYGQFISEAFDSGWFAQEIDRVAALIAPYVENDPTAFCTYEEFQTGVSTLRSFCLLRAQSVTGQLEGSIPSTSEGQRNTDALVDASHLNLSDMGSMGDTMGGGRQGGDFGGFGGRLDRNEGAQGFGSRPQEASAGRGQGDWPGRGQQATATDAAETEAGAMAEAMSGMTDQPADPMPGMPTEAAEPQTSTPAQSADPMPGMPTEAAEPQTSASAQPADPMPDMPAEATESQLEAPAQSAESQTDTPTSSRPLSGQSMPFPASQTGQNSHHWLLLAVCAAVLLAAIWLVSRYRTHL